MEVSTLKSEAWRDCLPLYVWTMKDATERGGSLLEFLDGLGSSGCIDVTFLLLWIIPFSVFV